MMDRITWFGHAAFALEVGGYHVLVDPFFTGNPAASTTAEEVSADYILVSHAHGDHLGDSAAIARRTGAVVVTNSDLAKWFEKQDIETNPQQIGGGHQYPFGYLKFTLALHGSALPDGSYGGNPVGFLLTTGEGKRIYLACDTGLFGDMRLIGEEGIELAALPIGDNYTMGPDDALRAVKLIQPRRVIPIHYSTWDFIDQDPDAWAQRVRQETGVEVHVLKPGESIEL